MKRRICAGDGLKWGIISGNALQVAAYHSNRQNNTMRQEIRIETRLLKACDFQSFPVVPSKLLKQSLDNRNARRANPLTMP